MFDRLSGRLRPVARLASICLLVAGVLSPFAPAALAAAGPYSSGGVGYDVSYPNCSQTIATIASNGHPYSVAVVGVTGGRAFSSNSCLSGEFTRAKAVTASPSLYMNLNAPVGSTASEAKKGPKTCARSDKSCMSYNYGYQAALSAQSYATGAGASSTTWWLDIETGNSWSSNQAANFQVIQGAKDALSTNGVSNVGVYSTSSMWKKITGSAGATSGLPVWTAPGTTSLTNAATFCNASASFTGGPVWLVQYSGGSYDEDYAC